MAEAHLKVLKRVNAILKSGAQWTKFCSFADDDGNGLGLSPTAVKKATRFCLSGAVIKAAVDVKVSEDEATETRKILTQAIRTLFKNHHQKRYSTIVSFNDSSLVNFGNVKVAIKEAILIAKETK